MVLVVIINIHFFNIALTAEQKVYKQKTELLAFLHLSVSV